jgi:Flp pilus assembly protein TadG
MTALCARMMKRLQTQVAGACGEDGGSLVEMALSCLILVPVLFGIIQLSIGLYCYHFAADASREASRWAMVRGANCNGYFGTAYCSPTDANSNGATANDVSHYVASLGYPFSGAVTTSTQWCVNGGSTPATWTSCSTTQNNSVDNHNQVKVTVTYAYPLVIPFVKKLTLNLNSSSSMTIVQ